MTKKEKTNLPQKLNLFFSFIILFTSAEIFCQNLSEIVPRGGISLLKNFIKRELVYPPKCIVNKTEGTVEIACTVKKDGSVENIVFSQKTNSELDSEAMRIFRKILWEPATDIKGKKDGITTLTIRFKIKQYKKWVKTRGYDSLPYLFPHDTSFKIYQYNQLEKAPAPYFQDSLYTYSRFIQDNLKYPDDAFRQSIEGDVKISFIIEPYGKVSNIKILNYVGGGCTEEAIRLLEMMTWLPGVLKGKAVRTIMNLTIKFGLNNSNYNYTPSNSSPMN